ncbi:MAG: hypothetical protein Tsb0020_28260 [Haliangiales bacterium]
MAKLVARVIAGLAAGWFALLLGGCGGDPERPPRRHQRPPAAAPPEPTAAGVEPASERRAASPALSEAAARAVLSERFRAAGYRVRYDVPLSRPGEFAFTADGYDPDRRVGFEYVATSERDTELSRAERAALAADDSDSDGDGVSVLIIDAAPGLDSAALAAAADAFLAARQPR